MKFIPFLFLALFISCDKKEATITPEKVSETKTENEMYTLETKNFFIDIPKGFAVNEMKVANKYAMKNYIKSDSLQYFLIASDNIHSKNTFDFNSNFIDSNLNLNDLNQKIYEDYKNKVQNETLKFETQKDTILNDKQINYLVFSRLFNDKPSQTMYVFIKENNKILNLTFQTDDVSSKINQEKTNWKIIESIGLK